MFYRRAGIRHLDYRHERQLWPLPFDKLLVGIVVVLALAAPFLVDRLYLIAYQLPWLIWSSAALGLNLLMGGAGQIHLGYGAVMAIGAYTSVHLVRFGVPLELAMLAGGLASALIGVVFGFAALRVKSLYLAMATIAMQYIVDFAITHIPGVSGGGMASIEVPPVRFLGVRIEGDLPTYYMALLVCAVIAMFLLNVNRTAFGRALAAIREKDYAAEIIGIDTFKFKLLAFWTSSFIGGVVGSVLVVCYLRSVSPEQFHLDLSVQLLAMGIVGGLGGVSGAGLVLFAPIVFNNLISHGADRLGIALNADLRAHLPLMLYGALIIAFLVAEPLGLAKIYDNVRNYFLVWPFRTARM